MSGTVPRVVRNAAAATIQVVASGLLLFLLYRFLLRELGIERMVFWSFVLSTTIAARITELGFSGGAVKFIAQHVANGDLPRASRAVETALLVAGGFVAVLLPWALASLWFTALGGICQPALDGCLRTDLRVMFAVASSLLALVLAMLLVPVYGLLGLAWTQLALAALLACASWACMRRELRHLPWVPSHVDREQFGVLARYGLNLQAGTILQLLTDPVTKALLTRFGGLAMTGYYEMASRMLMQLC